MHIYIYLNYSFFGCTGLWCGTWTHCCCTQLFLVAENRGYAPVGCAGFSLWWLLWFRSMHSRAQASGVAVHGLSCSKTRGIFPDQRLNPCPWISRQILNHWITKEAPTFYTAMWYTHFHTHTLSHTHTHTHPATELYIILTFLYAMHSETFFSTISSIPYSLMPVMAC